MLENTLRQPYIAMILFAVGTACGVVFSVISLWRYCTDDLKVRHFVADLLFSLTSGGVFLAVNFAINNGDFKLYAMLSFFVGIAAAYLILKMVFFKFMSKIKNSVLKSRRKFKESKAGKFLTK